MDLLNRFEITEIAVVMRYETGRVNPPMHQDAGIHKQKVRKQAGILQYSGGVGLHYGQGAFHAFFLVAFHKGQFLAATDDCR